MNEQACCRELLMTIFRNIAFNVGKHLHLCSNIPTEVYLTHDRTQSQNSAFAWFCHLY